MKLKILTFATLSLIVTSCATIFNGAKSKVTFDSNLAAADHLSIDNNYYNYVRFPFEAKVKNGYKSSRVVASCQGYEDSEIIIEKRFNSIYLGNILLGLAGIPAMAVDLAVGSVMKTSDNSYYLHFYKPSEQNGVISEEKPYQYKDEQVLGVGDTALESTIIRWYVVSSPAGADVQWRVISSNADVKNTNQSYLGSTPYESTESFDIMGLTYNNSGNVQIEISCEKIGYITQRKRFNLRQAIDQKEISTKFNLVKED